MKKKTPAHDLLFPMVVLIALMVLVPSLQPGIGWYNTGEFAAAAMTLDVPHAPGYPFFTRLANLMLRLPLPAEPAWKVNLLSAICGGLGAGVFALWLRAGGLSPLLAGAAALWMISFTTFWEVATSAEVYTTEILLLAAFLVSMWRIRQGPVGVLGWILIGLILGLGVGHRPTFLPLAVGIFLVGLFCPPRPGEPLSQNTSSSIPWASLTWGSLLPGLVLGFALGMLPTFDLFLRLQMPGLVLTDPQMGQGFDGFWRIFTASAYRKGLGVFSFPEVLSRGRAWLELMIENGGLAAVVLPWFAWLGSLSAWNPQVLVLTWILLVNTGFVLNYNAFEAHTMLLPSMLALTGLAAHGLHVRRGRGKAFLGYGLAVVAAVSFFASSHRIEPRQRDAEQWAERLAMSLPRGATLLVSNDVEFRPLWYLRLARRFRPDLGFRLIDRIEEKDLEEIGKDVVGRGAFGTLVYPEDLRSWLSTRFRLEPLGYVTAVLPPAKTAGFDRNASWAQPLAWGGAGEIRAAITGCVSLAENGLEQRKSAFGIAAPGDVLDWKWQATGIASGLQDLVAGLCLVDEVGALHCRQGVALGFDLHSLADGMTPELFRQAAVTGSCGSRRALVIPPNIPSGRYRLCFFISRLSHPGWKKACLERLPGLNLLNEDGATEVFKLRHGTGNSPLIGVRCWEELAGLIGEPASWSTTLGWIEIR